MKRFKDFLPEASGPKVLNYTGDKYYVISGRHLYDQRREKWVFNNPSVLPSLTMTKSMANRIVARLKKEGNLGY